MAETNNLQQKKLYSRLHLMDRLKEEGLPFSEPTTRDYVKKGIITLPGYIVVFVDREWGFYSQEEIEENVRRVREHNTKTL